MILVVVRHVLACDDCRAIGPEAATVAEVRQQARSLGWRQAPTGEDYCPNCLAERQIEPSGRGEQESSRAIAKRAS